MQPVTNSTESSLVTHVRFFDHLPLELIKHIFSYIAIPCSLSLTNRSFRELTNLWYLWELEKIHALPLMGTLPSESTIDNYKKSLVRLHQVASHLSFDCYPYSTITPGQRFRWECETSRELCKRLSETYPYYLKKNTVNTLRLIGLKFDLDIPQIFHSPTGDGVTAFDIEEILIFYTHPDRISRLTQLKAISENLYFIPSLICRFPYLEKLNFSLNLIFQVPSQISLLSHLKKLNLQYNRLDTLPSELSTLPHLKTLNLGDNHFRQIPPCVFRIASLKRLLLHRNGINLIPNEISSLTRLTKLNLNRNYVKIIPDEVSKLHNLRELCVICNQIESLPDTLALMRGLRGLYVMGNRLTELPCSLEQLPNLTRLDISCNRIKYIPYSLLIKPNLIIYNSKP